MKFAEVVARLQNLLTDTQEEQNAETLRAAIMHHAGTLARELETDMRNEAQKASGRRSSAAPLNAMIKRNKKQPRAALQGAWIDNKGRQCVCDGFTAFRLNEPLPLEPIPENVEPMNLDKIFPALDEYMPVRIPSAGDLKVDHEMERAAHGRDAKNLHSFGAHLPTVNRAYLLDVLKVFPDAHFYVRKEYAARLVSPLYFASKDGDGLLLPIRTGEANRTKYGPESFAREFAPAQ